MCSGVGLIGLSLAGKRRMLSLAEELRGRPSSSKAPFPPKLVPLVWDVEVLTLGRPFVIGAGIIV